MKNSFIVSIATMLFWSYPIFAAPLPEWPAGKQEEAQSANAVSEFLSRLLQCEKDRIERVLQRDVDREKTTWADIAARWKVLHQQFVNSGVDPAEAQEVLRIARGSVTIRRPGMPYRHWPIWVQRGFVEKEAVWTIVLAWPKSKKVKYPERWPYEPDVPFTYQIVVVSDNDDTERQSMGAGHLQLQRLEEKAT